MKRSNYRLPALFLTAAILLTSASCLSEKGGEENTVKAEDTFFTSQERAIFLPGEEQSVSEVSNIKITPQAIIVSVQYAVGIIGGGEDDGNTGEFVEETILYSLAEGTVKKLDVGPYLHYEISMCMSVAIRPDGYAEAMYVVFDPETYAMENQWFQIDPGSGKVISELSYDVSDTFPEGIQSFEIDAMGNRYFAAGDTIVIYDEAGNKLSELKDSSYSGTLQAAEGFVYAGRSEDGSIGTFYRIDADKKSLDSSVGNPSIGQIVSLDGNSYSLSADKEILNSAGEAVFSWLDTDANLSHYLQKCNYIVIDEENICALGVVKKADQVSVFCSLLSKADKNPNSGKTVLTLGGINVLDDMDLMASVYEYNLFSKNTFLRIRNYPFHPEEEGQDYNKILQQLYMDAREEGGIDIVMNTAGDLGVSPDMTFLDLAPYMTGLMRDPAYFGNLFRAFYEGDKLYQIPTFVGISGISAEEDKNLQKMTWEEMETYLSNHPEVAEEYAQYDQQEWLNLFLRSSAGTVFSKTGDRPALDRETLAAILSFSKEYGKYSDTWTTEPLTQTVISESDSVVLTVNSLADVCNASYYQGHPLSIMGLPGSNGLSILPKESAAVSAACGNPEEAVRFVKILLAKNHQAALAERNDGIPVLCEAVEDRVESILATYDTNYLSSYYYEIEPTKEHAEIYLEIIRAADGQCGDDKEALAIIQEEAIVYFAGQNDMETVLDKISNRLTTLREEEN